jgi:hypothetical protein
MRGRSIKLSPPQRMITDLMHFASRVPTVPVQKRISLERVIAARAACAKRPRWTAIFTKAYGLVGQDIAELRRAYVKIPRPHLYEYPITKGVIVLEREYGGHPAVWPLSIKDPARLTLGEIDRWLEYATTEPIEDIKDFRQFLRIARLPSPIRRALWWIGLNVGRQRGNFFGTFAVSVYSALQAESLHPLSPLTTVLNYGVIGGDGGVNVRIIYDHRVMNGATVARALARLEEVLNSSVLAELAGMAAQAPPTNAGNAATVLSR